MPLPGGITSSPFHSRPPNEKPQMQGGGKGKKIPHMSFRLIFFLLEGMRESRGKHKVEVGLKNAKRR